MIKLTPPKITPYWLNEDRKLCDIVAHNKILGDLTLNTKYYPDVTERFITELRNKYDLHMKVERYTSNEENITSADKKFIRL